MLEDSFGRAMWSMVVMTSWGKSTRAMPQIRQGEAGLADLAYKLCRPSAGFSSTASITPWSGAHNFNLNGARSTRT